MARYDAILIPGGGLTPDGEVHPWVRNRLERCIELIDECDYLITLSRGTTHKPPPTNAQGWPILESEAAARYLVDKGIPPGRIVTEGWSVDTIGNAYFSRVIHVEPMKLSRLLVVTSEFHLARTKAIFDWVYGLSGGSFSLDYLAMDNVGLAPDVLEARREKERQSLLTLNGIIPRITTLETLHRWLFFEHGAYKAIPNVSTADPSWASY